MNSLKALILFLGVVNIYADTYNIYNIRPNAQVNFVNGNAVIQQNSNQINGNSGYRSPAVLHSDGRVYHLGDERFRSRKWARLYGQCYFIGFNDNGNSGNYYLSLNRYGTESAAIFINEQPVGYLPRQARGYRKRPNYWSGQEWISLPSNLIYGGRNNLAICSSPVPRPEFPGDVDDFQISNIKLIKN
jgi:hypothetical protein